MKTGFDQQSLRSLGKIAQLIVLSIFTLMLLIFAIPVWVWYAPNTKDTPINKETAVAQPADNYWHLADIALIQDETERSKVAYGKELIIHTAKYLGPNGSVAQISNGMNCQNCHLDAGTRVFGNNYGSVAATYPKFRARSGSIEDIHKRVNDCFERSLNGAPLDTASKEMAAIAAYIQYVGSNTPKGKKAEGSGLKEMAYLDRAADPVKGQVIYEAKCKSCHQANGEGTLLPDGSEYSFPPLWGEHSYNDAAGLYRISNFAKYVKYNMPLGADYQKPELTDEEAWDVAAFVNSRVRPHKDTPADWPDISKKPIDHPFGPFADSFTDVQHKFGPFIPIMQTIEKQQMSASNK